MPITLTQKDREELTPLLRLSQAELEFVPEEILKKLEVLKNEKATQDDFVAFEAIIDESLQYVKSLASKSRKPRHIKKQLWWRTHYKIFIAQRKNHRARRKSKLKS